jgi:hypothetical protein
LAATRARKTDLQLLTASTLDVTVFTVPGDPEEGTAEQSFSVGKFKFIKSLLVLESLATLARRVDLGSLFLGDEPITLERIVELLPMLLTTFRPTVVKILALTLLPNKRLEQLVDDEVSLEAELAGLRRVVYGLDFNQAAELLMITIDRIGFQDIRDNLPKFLGALRMG